MSDKKNEPKDIPISFDDDDSIGSNSEEGSDLPREIELANGPSDQQQNVEPGEQEEAEDAAKPDEPREDPVAQLQAQIDALTAERASLYDKLIRRQAEFENYRKRVEREGDAEALRHGVELIHKQFKDALSKLGLEAVEAVGQTFDPHVHEAVTTEATDKHKENTVIQEFQRGYRIGDRLLRPAKVKVASSPEK